WLNLYLGAWYGWEEGDTTDTDWLDEILRTGQVDEYNINVSGGTDKIKYYVSGGYFRNEGIVIATELERYSLRSNVDYDGKVVDFGLSSAVAHSMTLSVPTQSQYVNPIVAAYDLRPIEAVYNEDGSWNEDAYYNAVMVAEEDENYKRQITANINPYVTVDFGKGFSAKSNLGLDIYNLREFDYRSVYNPQGTDYNGLGQQYDYTNLNLMITNTINYNTKIDKHNISAMVGQEAQRIHSESSFFSASNYTYLQNTEIGGASTPSSAGSYTSQSHLASYFLNANYDYDDKYYLSGSLRYDGYSGFGMNNLWGTFYSIGGKWRVSQEAFFAPIQHVVNNLALRASYGTVGNSDIGWYASRGLYTSGYTYDSKPGALMSQIANDDLTWESRAKFNVGLDFRLFNRLNVEVDYYDERTKDMIFEMPVSHTVGTSYYMDNVGEMLNRGIEVLVNANIINTPNFSWDFNFNITKNHNEILKLDTDSPIEGTVTIRKVGEAYNTFYMAEYAGVDSETGAAMWYKGTEGTETTTDYTEAGQRIVGTADPKFYGGFGSSFKFRNFDASFQFNYKVGGKVYNSGFSYDMQVGHYYFGPVTNYVYENSWTPENTDTDVPIFVAGDDSNANATSSRFLMDASYLRLSNLSIGYTLPRSVSSRLKLDNVRIFATADNLFTVTASDYIGFDPECGSTGIQSWVYPTATTYMFGVQLGF
ncbi:MAG: SusC/RagA family TonB-linked outer membrane protein, partial [Rikenellaceae bacterium]